MGRVFEIREFCLHDGPGPRTTVFLQGCPLRCAWCQNPEGQSLDGGREMSAAEVVAEIAKTADFLAESGGGVTFSGGEPLHQPDFIMEIADLIRRGEDIASPISLALETSGFALNADYRRVVSQIDLVLQDVKFPDVDGYRKWTGVDAAPIFENIEWLKMSGIPFIVRIPTISGVNDSLQTKEAFAAYLSGAGNLQCIELLPYNRLAGAKYAKLGRTYAPGFDESAVPDLDGAAFVQRGMKCIARSL